MSRKHNFSNSIVISNIGIRSLVWEGQATFIEKKIRHERVTCELTVLLSFASVFDTNIYNYRKKSCAAEENRIVG